MSLKVTSAWVLVKITFNNYQFVQNKASMTISLTYQHEMIIDDVADFRKNVCSIYKDCIECICNLGSHLALKEGYAYY